jgi:tRNA G18 (ribose-2'-O)-methylase SpoU
LAVTISNQSRDAFGNFLYGGWNAQQKKIEKAVKSTQILLQNNREKLQNIESELNHLEEQIAGYEHVKKSKFEEKEQKANMADFTTFDCFRLFPSTMISLGLSPPFCPGHPIIPFQ